MCVRVRVCVCVCMHACVHVVLHCLLHEIQVSLPGYVTEAAKAVLPIPVSVYSIFMCPVPVSEIVNMFTDVDTYDCTQWLYKHSKGVCTES